MATKSPPIPTWRGKVRQVAVPRTRDPFINTKLIAAGRNENGEERFWISTWNSHAGPLGALVSETGDARIYCFPVKDDWTRGGYYSAAAQDNDTLWLCCNLQRVARLDLRTGRIQEFDTGAPSALVFSGMALDQDSGKLFAIAFPPPQTTAFSFDFRHRKPVKVYPDLGCLDHYMQCSYPNSDGSWTLALHCPGRTLVRWNPQAETVNTFSFQTSEKSEDLTGGSTYHLIDDDHGRRYLSGHGWYDPLTGKSDPQGPRPQMEMTWFARRGGQAWGVTYKDAQLTLGLWDLTTGQVRQLAIVPDGQVHNVNLTQSGKLIVVNIYGQFFRIDGQSGALEMTRRLDSDAIGHTDCLRRIDKHRLLGTPFITQRFWEVNLDTGKGQDCGRAAPGAGEVLRTWKLGGMIYMAAYTGAELMEYDPSRPARFPENPRVVADPPHAMRPVASADDGRNLYYASSTSYGTLGSILTRYDTRTGLATYFPHPLPDQQIQSLLYDRKRQSLMAGTTMHADCQSCPPSSKLCYLAEIDAQDGNVRQQAAMPPGAVVAAVVAPLGRGRYLCTCTGELGGESWTTRWFTFDAQDMKAPSVEEMRRLPQGFERWLWAGKPALMVLQREQRIELWDMRQIRCRRILMPKARDMHLHSVQEGSVYLLKHGKVIILENALTT